MPERLPVVGGDLDGWATVLNGFLGVSHDSTGHVTSSAITTALGYTPINKAGDTSVGALSLGTSNTLTAGATILGTNPASAGTVRMPNNTWVAARNAANGGDINMFKVTSGDVINPGAQIFRDDFGSASLAVDAATPPYLNLRRRFTNLTGSQNSPAVFHCYASGTLGISHRSNGIVSTVEDDTVAGVTSVRNKTITAMSRSGTTVTVTATAHGFANGDRIAIGGVTHTFNAEINGVFTVANQAANTFDVTLAGLSSGSYTSGGTATNRPMYYGVASYVGPVVDRGGLTGTAQFADDVACFVGLNGGTAKGTDAYYLGRNAAIAGSEWGTSFTFDANADYGIRLNGTYAANGAGLDFHGTFNGWGITFGGTFANHAILSTGTITSGYFLSITGTSSSGGGLNLGGSFSSYAIDFNNMSGAGSLMRLKNNVAVVGRNNAGSADVQLFYINTSDELHFPIATRFNNNITIGNTFNIAFSTSTGTKIGTGATQKLALWGKTPVVQPAAYTVTNVTTDRTYDANATSIDELADVLGTLIADIQSWGGVG